MEGAGAVAGQGTVTQGGAETTGSSGGTRGREPGRNQSQPGWDHTPKSSGAPTGWGTCCWGRNGVREGGRERENKDGGTKL